ncbi:MAG TPA: TfoX/Sxy family protein [Pyrinomonadaceae bacterium]|nr:TfoX/Sxy family protein [Pyrinomonadaceae bacterium]
MPKPNVKSGHKAILDSLLLNMPSVVDGKMFGYPAYFVNGKLFACVYGEGVGVKVPEEVANKLLAEKHVVPFQPLGKPKMREWIQINRARPTDYGKDINVFRTSIEFVSQLQTTKRKKK